MIFTRNGQVVTQLTWAAPVARQDGSAYGTADHAGYVLGVSDPANPNDSFTEFVAVPAAYAVTSWPLSQLNMTAPGAYEVALATVDRGGRQSPWSNPLSYEADLSAPNAPTGFGAS